MLTGGCQCGALRYKVLAEPLRTYCCHCTECRAQSASAFGISVIVPTNALRITAGEPKIWARRTAGGKMLACAFCATCGTRVWHADAPAGEALSVKGGSLDTPADLTGADHIWTASKLPGVCIPADARQWPGEPD